MREGFRIAVIGAAPNAGKSSLFNALVEREAAIVTPMPGTTRDVIEGHLVLAGYKVLLADTAGRARETDEAIEAEGAPRSRRGRRRPICGFGWSMAPPDDGDWREAADLVRPDDFCVLNKADLPARHRTPAAPGGRKSDCGPSRSRPRPASAGCQTWLEL